MLPIAVESKQEQPGLVLSRLIEQDKEMTELSLRAGQVQTRGHVVWLTDIMRQDKHKKINAQYFRSCLTINRLANVSLLVQMNQMQQLLIHQRDLKNTHILSKLSCANLSQWHLLFSFSLRFVSLVIPYCFAVF